MIRSTILAIALMFSASATAQTTVKNPCENLPETTKNMSVGETAVVLQACRQPEAPSTVVAQVKEVVNPENANTWASAAKGFAHAIGTAAKELGIAANDFLNSPAGYLLAFILLVNYAGAALFGVPFTVFTVLVYLYVFKRLNVKRVEYENHPIFWGFATIRRIKTIEYKSTWDDYEGGFLFGTAIVMFAANCAVWALTT